MPPKVWLAIGCLLIGLPLAAWGLANGMLLVGLGGLAFVLAFVYLVIEAMNAASKPKHEIIKSPDAAWNLKNEPPPAGPPDRRGGTS